MPTEGDCLARRRTASRIGSGRRRQRGLPALALALAVFCLASACRTDDPVALSFSEVLEHQRDNLTTGLISVADGVNGHLLEHGWRLGEPGAGFAELTQAMGHIRLFAARAEWTQLAVRGAIDGGAGQRRFRALLNGRPLGSIGFGPQWRTERLDLPAGSVRRGPNLLALRCLDCPLGRPHAGPNLRLRQLRLLPAPAQTRRIRPADQDGGRFLMPAPAYLDAVVELPDAAAFHGDVALSRAAGGPASARLKVLDRSGERLAGEWRLAGQARQRLRADLSAWAGRKVRLRLEAVSDGEVELDWLRAVVTGRGGPEAGGRLLPAAPAAPPRSGRLGRPDIVIVLLDAARADAFRPFGGPRPSPALERLAADGTRFSQALAPSSWTRPSVAALFTGLYPDSVGAGTWGAGRPLATPTLAELLSAAGYRTVLWHQHPFYRGQPDLRRGFEEVHWARTGLVDPVPPADRLTAADRPTFALVHLLPPHAPYTPPPPFRGAFSSWYDGDLEVTASLLNQFHGRRDRRQLSPEDRRYIRDLYQENAAYADSLVGRILDSLVAAERYEEGLIVVLSDHGEAFLEHGRFLHTQQLYDESIHVPLIVKWPAGTGAHAAEVAAPVSLVDLAPTLVDGLALETGGGFQGRSLLPAALDSRAERRPIYATTRGATESWRPPAPRAALRHGTWKAVYDPLADRLELYDLANDPREAEDLASARPVLALWLRQALLEQMALNAALFQEDGPPPADPIDPELEEQLRDLGYLGGS